MDFMNLKVVVENRVIFSYYKENLTQKIKITSKARFYHTYVI